jgi:hypothetical protein
MRMIYSSPSSASTLFSMITFPVLCKFWTSKVGTRRVWQIHAASDVEIIGLHMLIPLDGAQEITGKYWVLQWCSSRGSVASFDDFVFSSSPTPTWTLFCCVTADSMYDRGFNLSTWHGILHFERIKMFRTRTLFGCVSFLLCEGF